MGTTFFITNPVRRQYLDPAAFGDNDRDTAVLAVIHALAVARLTCPFPYDTPPSDLAGSWCDGPVVAALSRDEPNPPGLTTSTPEMPERNLYTMCWQEFDDVSAKAIAMLCDFAAVQDQPSDPGRAVASQLAARLKDELASPYVAGEMSCSAAQFFRHLGNALEFERYGRLAAALSDALGREWRRELEKALRICEKYE